jgi:ornithine--oxo-acid transaminase
LLIGLEIDPARASARAVCDRLRAHGVLTKDTHETVVRLAPPLVITRDTLDEALQAIRLSLAEVADRAIADAGA